MCTYNISCRFPHSCYIKASSIKICISSSVRIRQWCVEYPVLVCLFAVTMPWMKIILHLLRFNDNNILRQHVIERILYLVCRNCRIAVKNSHIPLCVNSCISTARTNHRNFRSHKLVEGALKSALNSSKTRLYLPAAIFCSVISYAKQITHIYLHSIKIFYTDKPKRLVKSLSIIG